MTHAGQITVWGAYAMLLKGRGRVVSRLLIMYDGLRLQRAAVLERVHLVPDINE